MRLRYWSRSPAVNGVSCGASEKVFDEAKACFLGSLRGSKRPMSPSSNFLTRRRRAERLVLAPDDPSSLKTARHPAFFNALSHKAGSGRWSRRGRSRVSCAPFWSGHVNTSTLLFAGFPATVHIVPIIQHRTRRDDCVEGIAGVFIARPNCVPALRAAAF
jgi:hypothetical protein